MTTETSSNAVRWRVLAGGILIQMLLGTIYGYSIFWTPLTSEVFPEVITQAEASRITAAGESVEDYRVVEDEAAAERQQALHQSYLRYAFSICVLSFALVMIFAGRLQDLKGPRVPALIGGFLIGGGFLTAGLMASPIVFYLAHAAFAGAIVLALLMLSRVLLSAFQAQRGPIADYLPWAIVTGVIVAAITLANQYVGRLGEWDAVFLLWGTIGFLAGAGVGFAYVCPIAALTKWFPNNKGLVSGLAVAGFGFGAYFFKGDPYIFSTEWLTIPILGAQGFADAFGIQALFVAHGLVCVFGIGIGALMLKNPPGVPLKAAVGSESVWQETLRSPAFYMLWLMFFSGSVAGLMVIGIVQPFVSEQLVGTGMELGRATAIGTAAVGYLAVFNALGRIIWGLVSDRLGRTAVFIGVFVIQAIVMFLLGHLTSPVALSVAAAAVGFNYGGKFALFPSATSDFFGAKNLGANYGWLFTSYGIAGVVGIAAGNAARVLTGSYVAAFTIAGLLCLISAGLALVLRSMRRTLETQR